MAELFNYKRVVFPKNKQREFLNRAIASLDITLKECAEMLGISIRTLTDWKREKFLIPIGSAKILHKKSGIPLPSNLVLRNRYWYVTKGGRKGGIAVYKKYGVIGGDQNYRLVRWRKWWKKVGRLKPSHLLNTPLPFQIPHKSEKLAEFVGIMLGDGGISKYQLTVTLHYKDDARYARFIMKLLKELFSVKPSVHCDLKNSVNNIVISRIKLIEFLNKEIGLKIGNKIKQKIDIPIWIKQNKKFQCACMRGLIDTDGCLVIHKYKVNGKQYCYKKLNFCSASPPLISSVIQILKKFNFNPRLSHNGRNVWIDNQKEVARYLIAIGSNNPKHLLRYKN